MEGFTGAGFWWLESRADARVFGTISYDRAGGFDLEIPAGALGSHQDWLERVNKLGALQNADVGTVLGDLKDGTRVTLFDCKPAGFSLSMPGMSSEKFRSVRGVTGKVHVRDDATVSSVRFHVHFLRDWANISDLTLEMGFRDNDRSDGTFAIRRKPSEPKFILASAAFELSLSSQSGFSGGPIAGFTVKHECSLQAAMVDPIELARVDEVVLSPVSGFMTVALDCSALVHDIEVMLAGTDEWTRAYYTWGRESESAESRLTPWMLLPLGSKLVDTRAIMRRWLELDGDGKHAARILAALTVKDSIGLDSRLLLCAQALESVHRVVGVRGELDDDVFRARLDAIDDSCLDAKVKQWAHRKLRHSNTKPLERQLHELCDFAGPVVQKIAPDRERFLRDLRRSRNFFAHGDQTTSQPLDGEELHWLTEAATLLLRACVLRLLGIDEDSTVLVLMESQGFLQTMVHTSAFFAVAASQDSAP